jgi:outer membrane immunogenic protein
MHEPNSHPDNHMIRNLILSIAAMTALTGTVLAADLPMQAPPPAVYMPPPVFSWTGFYLGINGGGAVGSTQFDFNNLGITTTSRDFSGGFVGGTAGYDWAWNGPSFGNGPFSWVVGVLADADWADITNGFNCAGNLGFSCNVTGNFLGSVRARVGWSFDRILFYGTGGLGLGNARFSVTDNVTGLTVVDNVFRAGFTAGGGIEYALVPNWAVKFEYLFYDFQHTNSGLVFPAAGFGALDAGSVTATTFVHTFRFGVDYKFLPPPPAPVIAKY